MSGPSLPALWCVLQTGLIASLGALAAWGLSRRWPAAAATAAAGGAATILAVTLVAPLPTPAMGGWLGAPDEGPGRPLAAIDSSAVGGTVRDGVRADIQTIVEKILATVGELGRAKPQAARGVEVWIGGAMVVGAVLGLWRLAAAVRYVARVRRRCTPVVDEATRAAFAEIARRLNVRRLVALCESTELTSPAVIGWRRPLVLLPASRAGWREEQLRATLAHELAHVVRGDFAWRLAASCVRAVHFFHPLVHVLARRLALAQELAADRLAASVVGGSTAYLQALSELAIRLDDPTRLRAEPIVLPALSTHLMRRIAMLRSTDGSVDTKRKRAIGVAAATLIAMVGAATTALRGAADAVVPASSSALFTRAPLDPSGLGGLHEGLFVVRVGELSQRPMFGFIVDSLHASCQELWPQVFNVAAPPIDLSIIEYVAGVPQLTIEPTEGDDPNRTGRMMFGAGEVIVRLSQEVALEPWLEKYIPRADKHADGELTYFELPEIPFMGNVQMLVAAADGRTIVCTWGVDRMKAVMAGQANASTTAETAQWLALDGGLATFVANDANVDHDMLTPKAPRAQDIVKHVQRYGFAFDMDPATGQAGIRWALTCSDEAAATQVADAVTALLPQMKNEIEAQIKTSLPDHAQADEGGATPAPPLSAPELAYMNFWVHAIESCQVRVETSEGGGACVRIFAAANFSPPSLVGMQELAKRAPDADDAGQK